MKGFMLTMESVAACIIIAMLLVFITSSYAGTGREIIDEGIAYDILQSLDDRGLLRGYAESLDYGGLDSIIETPYNHSIMICTGSGGCFGPEPPSGNVWAGSYFTAGNGAYSPREIILYIWKVQA